jgi:hypothetical protein
MGCLHANRFMEVRDPLTGKLLFRFDPVADVVEVKHKGCEAVRVSLKAYRESEPTQQ